MTPPNTTLQQEWLQVAYNTLTRQLLPRHFPYQWDQGPTIVSYGYGPGGRRGKTPWRYFRQGTYKTEAHVLFVSPHAWTTAVEVLNLLTSAAIHARMCEFRRRVKPRTVSLHWELANCPAFLAERDALEMFLPPFPAAPFDSETLEKQSARLRKYVCACRRPVVRVASDQWRATCRHCHQDFQRVCPNCKTVGQAYPCARCGS